MGLIVSIILGLLALIIVNAILYALCRKWRWLRWVLPLIVGMVSFFVWGKWWLALLIYLFTFGILLSITETKDKRGRAIHCSNCAMICLILKRRHMRILGTIARSATMRLCCSSSDSTLL